MPGNKQKVRAHQICVTGQLLWVQSITEVHRLPLSPNPSLPAELRWWLINLSLTLQNPEMIITPQHLSLVFGSLKMSVWKLQDITSEVRLLCVLENTDKGPVGQSWRSLPLRRPIQFTVFQSAVQLYLLSLPTHEVNKNKTRSMKALEPDRKRISVNRRKIREQQERNLIKIHYVYIHKKMLKQIHYHN